MTAAVHKRAATGGSDNWQTPECVLDRVLSVDDIGLDPCTTHDNPTCAEKYFTPAEDGLTQPWDGHGLVFDNFPYSAAAAWAAKTAEEAARTEIISLVAARPDTRWFHAMVWATATAVCFWKGRLRFVGAAASAPFPSAVVYHGARVRRFESAFEDAGKVLRL